MAFPSLKAKANGGPPRELIPHGLHYAICTQLIDLGVQRGRPGNSDSAKAWISFEIPDHRVKFQVDGKEVTGPGLVGREFGVSLGEKSHLGPFLTSWRGKAFTEEELSGGYEMTSIVGKPCQLLIMHSVPKSAGQRSYANVENVLGLSEQLKKEIQEGRRSTASEGGLVVYSTEAHDQATYDLLPDFLKRKIDNRVKTTPAAVSSSASQVPDFDDDIPF